MSCLALSYGEHTLYTVCEHSCTKRTQRDDTFMATIASHPTRPGLARRLLASPVVALLLAPHGVDRYLELISPTLTVGDARAEVVAVRRQTERRGRLRWGR